MHSIKTSKSAKKVAEIAAEKSAEKSAEKAPGKAAEKRLKSAPLVVTAKYVGDLAKKPTKTTVVKKTKVQKYIAKANEKNWHRESRNARFKHQRFAAKLLNFEGRVGLCKYAVISAACGVTVQMTDYEASKTQAASTRASFGGLQTCGLVWLCPICAARISEVRRKEMNELLAWARASGYKVQMITLTARHGIEDDLEVLLERMKKAKKGLHQHSRYKSMKSKIVGTVTATEVTGGGFNGWHPHFHVIVITYEDTDLEQLGRPWLANLRGVGLSGAGAAFQVQNADTAGNYIAKWGAAEELTLSNKKCGRGKESRSPAQLLAAACDDGDHRAGALWAEYAHVFKGRKQLIWSDNLKKLASIDQVSDEEAATDETQDAEPVDLIEIAYADWTNQKQKGDNKKGTGACRRRGHILNAAETGGAEAALAVVEDRAFDENVIEDFSVIDDEIDHEIKAKLDDDLLDDLLDELAKVDSADKIESTVIARNSDTHTRAKSAKSRAKSYADLERETFLRDQTRAMNHKQTADES